MNPKLQKILEDRKKKLSVITPALSDIHDRTVRAEKNLVAGEKEFITKRGKYIDKGTLYHIHFTNDNKSYYMTGGEHNQNTKLICEFCPGAHGASHWMQMRAALINIIGGDVYFSFHDKRYGS